MLGPSWKQQFSLKQFRPWHERPTTFIVSQVNILLFYLHGVKLILIKLTHIFITRCITEITRYNMHVQKIFLYKPDSLPVYPVWVVNLNFKNFINVKRQVVAEFYRVK